MTPLIRLVAATGAGALAAALLTLAQGAVSASAAEQGQERGQALVSFDGVHFAADAPGSVFPADVPLAPGSVVDGRFWVRNDSDVRAALALSVSGATATTTEFIDALALAAGTGDTVAASVPLASAASACIPLLQGEILEPGATVEVRMGLSMSPAVGNGGQGATADARLQVSLTDARAPLAAADCSGNPMALTGTAVDPDEPVEVASTTTAGGTAAELTQVDPAAPEPGTALPTMPFAGRPGLYPVLGVGGAVAGALLLLLLVRHRKRRTDVPQ